MKLSRMLVLAMAVAFVAVMATSSAEAATKSLGSGKVGYRAGTVVNGYSISWTTLLKYWKQGIRYWYD